MTRLLALLLLATPAHAQTTCAPLTDALTSLATRYQEQPRVLALSSDGRLLVITAAEEGGWTALLVSPDGTACIAAAGEALEVMEAEAPGVDG